MTKPAFLYHATRSRRPHAQIRPTSLHRMAFVFSQVRLGLLVRVLIGFVVLTITYTLLNLWTPQRAPLPTIFKHADPVDASDIFLVLKTGATAIHERLPIHLETTFTPATHSMIFSDYAQKFGDYFVHDAIDGVTESTIKANKDFDIYQKISQVGNDSEALAKLNSHDAWSLDKWKFLPMIHRATEAMEGTTAKWMVIIEADTSLSWPNLLHWLRGVDSNKPLYLGAKAKFRDQGFAHGGSGIVLSRKAAMMLEEVRRERGAFEYDQDWELFTSETPFGDYILARALEEAGIELKPSSPAIQGTSVYTLGWTDGHWCKSPITWHHVSPDEVEALWQFEANWADQQKDHSSPYLFRDVFWHFVEPYIKSTKTRWKGLEPRECDRKLIDPEIATDDDREDKKAVLDLSDIEKDATKSADACEAACKDLSQKKLKCIQWMFSPGRCYLAKVIRFGVPVKEDEEQWTSGWIQDRVASVVSEMSKCK